MSAHGPDNFEESNPSDITDELMLEVCPGKMI
jgi:hypothetical protein